MIIDDGYMTEVVNNIIPNPAKNDFIDITCYDKPEYICKIITLQIFFRAKLKLIHNISAELKHLSRIVQSIVGNINRLNDLHLLPNMVHVTYISKLDNIFQLFQSNILRPINLRNYGGSYA